MLEESWIKYMAESGILGSPLPPRATESLPGRARQPQQLPHNLSPLSTHSGTVVDLGEDITGACGGEVGEEAEAGHQPPMVRARVTVHHHLARQRR
jgi:hypothetical protein